MARLLFRDSQGREGTVELSPTETVYVGRGLECAIRTDDGMVSRRHSQIPHGERSLRRRGSRQRERHAPQQHARSEAGARSRRHHPVRLADDPVHRRGRGQRRAAAAASRAAAPPPKKGGTMVLERNDARRCPRVAVVAFGGRAARRWRRWLSPPEWCGAPAYGSRSAAAAAAGTGGCPTAVLPECPVRRSARHARWRATAVRRGAGRRPRQAGRQAAPRTCRYGGPPGMPGGGPPAGGSMSGAGRATAVRPAAVGHRGRRAGGSGPPVAPGAPGGDAGSGGPPGSASLPVGGRPGCGGPPAMPGGCAGAGATCRTVVRRDARWWRAPRSRRTSRTAVRPACRCCWPYGGPPAMPGAGAADPSMFGRGGPSVRGGAPRVDDARAENKVLVDLGLEFDPQKADGEIKKLRADLEKATANYEREVADGKRMRAEAATLRERIEELRAHGQGSRGAGRRARSRRRRAARRAAADAQRADEAAQRDGRDRREHGRARAPGRARRRGRPRRSARTWRT